MFENENHQRAYECLMQGNFRKAHSLIANQMNTKMGGLIWVDFLYLQTVVHPNHFDTDQLTQIAIEKPDWTFILELNRMLAEGNLSLATKWIQDQFEVQNTIRKNVLASDISSEDIERMIKFTNRPI